MKVPVSWLADHLAGGLPPTEEIADVLAIAGVEVESVEERGLPVVDGNAERYVAGLVVEAGKHPDADRLQLCRVDTGGAEPRQIVCGAWNFGAGDTVAVAVPGAVLPDGRTLEKAKLRGVVSEGMILSERELGLSDEHGGILVLGDGWAAGEPLAARLPLQDEVLHLEVTSNRPDMLCMRGVARDVAAVLHLRLAPLDASEPTALLDLTTEEIIRVGSEDLAGCPRFTARGFQDVHVGPSPLWLKARLSAAGVRPISNVVDVTNYVMLDLGQPLHAYDAALVPGRVLIARRARDGERLVTLDGKERVFTPDDLVIADGEGVSGVGGVMGGEGSEVSDATTEVALEAASFDRVSVQRTARRLGMHTDASHRFSRGVDPHGAMDGSRAAARLICELAGARMARDPLDVRGALPEREVVRMRAAKVGAVTGMEVTAAESEGALERLGFEPRPTDGGFECLVPTWRLGDVSREIDLVEEVARVVGLDRVPGKLPAVAHPGGLSEEQRLQRALADACVGAGLSEAVTLPLVAPGAGERLGLAPDDPRRDEVALSNPLSAELSVMRTMLLPSLLQAVSHNVALGTGDVALFELSRTYHPRADDPLPEEPLRLGGVLHGRLGGGSWTDDGRGASFFQARGVLDAVLRAVGLEAAYSAGGGADPFLHPGRAARVLVGGEEVGWLGELHPTLAAALDLPGAVAAFELDADALARLRVSAPGYRDVSEQPPLRQDIAVVVPDEHPAADVHAAVAEAGGDLLVESALFDVWRDASALGPDRRSLAFRLVFQAPDRTLTDEEVVPVRERIVQALADRFGAVLRVAEAAQPASDRVRVRRLPARGRYADTDVAAILDEALVSHLAFVHDGQPFAIPTLHARDGDTVLVHGSSASRTLRALGGGLRCCLTATLVDGIVLARSVFHHSVNYRSAVILGEATPVVDREEKLDALERFTDRVLPGRSREARAPTDLELKATSVLRLPLDEASAKVRSGPPGDDEEDLALDCWGGVLPLHTVLGAPEPDAHVRPGQGLPAALAGELPWVVDEG